MQKMSTFVTKNSPVIKQRKLLISVLVGVFGALDALALGFVMYTRIILARRVLENYPSTRRELE